MVLMHTDHGCIRHRALPRVGEEVRRTKARVPRHDVGQGKTSIGIVPVAISGISRYVRESRSFLDTCLTEPLCSAAFLRRLLYPALRRSGLTEIHDAWGRIPSAPKLPSAAQYMHPISPSPTSTWRTAATDMRNSMVRRRNCSTQAEPTSCPRSSMLYHLALIAMRRRHCPLRRAKR
jgi:hypothetical protein